MSSDLEQDINVAIRVSSLTKHYQIYEKPSDRLRQIIWRQRKIFYRNFTALKNIDLKIPKGETVGIIGRNGSGKSTLLQIICGTLQPSEGEVVVDGRIAALLELGAGFNPEFTGRENVYMQGTIQGIRKKDMDQQFDAIEAFAEIGEFIDQPVKTYSSGMYVRLAFAVAIHVDPDILVVDEALSVGDEAFRRKCFARIDQIQKRGATILFVSHSAQSIIQLCSHAILLDAGEAILQGDPKHVVNQYQKMMNLGGKAAAAARAQIIETASSGTVEQDSDEISEQEDTAKENIEGYDPYFVSSSGVEYEEKGGKISQVKILSEMGEVVNILQSGRSYTYQYRVDFTATAKNVGFGVMIKSTSGMDLGGATTQFNEVQTLPSVEAGQAILVSFKFTCRLLSKAYFLNAGVTSQSDGEFSYLHRIVDAYAFRIAPEKVIIPTGMFDFDFEPSLIKL